MYDNDRDDDDDDKGIESYESFCFSKSSIKYEKVEVSKKYIKESKIKNKTRCLTIGFCRVLLLLAIFTLHYFHKCLFLNHYTHLVY